MLEIRTLCSGSQGNCYRVSDGRTPLLLECGMRFQEIRKGLDFRVSDIAGCLLSHEHGDHAWAAKDIVRAGVDLYCSRGTADALGLCGHRVHIIRAKEKFTIGTWTVLPFDTVHDAKEPLGFLLRSGSEKLLFATDTAYIHYRFRNLTHIMVEANYDLETLRENVRLGRVNREVKKRVLKSHMSIQTVLDFLRANNLSRVREIWLLHLSGDNSDARQFKRKVQMLTGKEVRVA